MRLTVKKLFFIDGIGAVVSALALGILMPTFNHYFQVPINTLYTLAAVPVVFAAYDFLCFTRSTSGKALKIIAFGNMGYCVLSVFLLSKHIHVLTNLAFAYFLAEIVIVGMLAVIELKVANRTN